MAVNVCNRLIQAGFCFFIQTDVDPYAYYHITGSCRFTARLQQDAAHFFIGEDQVIRPLER